MVAETQRDIRIKKLLQHIKKTNRLHLKEAANYLNVSEMTIRRDLSKPSPVVLLGGYIVIDPHINPVTSYFVAEQKSRNIEGKRHVGQLAAAMINTHDMVFFDCGTTSPYVIEAISDDLIFTGICCSLNTFLALQEKPHCRVILCGGEFKQNNASFIPLSHYNILNHICPDKAFISAAGISLDHGITCFNLEETLIKNQVINASQQNILIIDNTKFDKVRPAKFGKLTKINTVVTNEAPSNKYIQYFSQNNIQLIY